MHKFVIVTIQVGDFQLDFAGVVEIVDVVVVAVHTAGVVVDNVVVVKTGVVVVADSKFSDSPEIVSYYLEEPPDNSHAIS